MGNANGAQIKGFLNIFVYAKRYFLNINIKVWYCTEQCKERDSNIHANHCKKKFEIEDSGLKAFTSNSKKGLVGKHFG